MCWREAYETDWFSLSKTPGSPSFPENCTSKNPDQFILPFLGWPPAALDLVACYQSLVGSGL